MPKTKTKRQDLKYLSDAYTAEPYRAEKLFPVNMEQLDS
jgi:hypothetical protein